jgi:hypothetical protein
MGAFGIRRLTYTSHQKEVVASLSEPCHQIHSGINDAPCKIAPERSDYHVTDLDTIGCGDTDRACDRQGHDQPKKNFGEPFNGFEYPVSHLSGKSSK